MSENASVSSFKELRNIYNIDCSVTLHDVQQAFLAMRGHVPKYVTTMPSSHRTSFQHIVFAHAQLQRYEHRVANCNKHPAISSLRCQP